jgi:hypothetical protein
MSPPKKTTPQRPQPLPRVCPALQQQLHLLFPTDQWRQPSARLHFKATVGRTLAQDAIDGHRCGDALDRVQAELLVGKIPLDQPMCGGADDDSIGLSDPLQPGGDVWCVSQGQLIAFGSAPDLADHHLRMG